MHFAGGDPLRLGKTRLCCQLETQWVNLPLLPCVFSREFFHSHLLHLVGRGGQDSSLAAHALGPGTVCCVLLCAKFCLVLSLTYSLQGAVGDAESHSSPFPQCICKCARTQHTHTTPHHHSGVTLNLFYGFLDSRPSDSMISLRIFVFLERRTSLLLLPLAAQGPSVLQDNISRDNRPLKLLIQWFPNSSFQNR